ncbi:MAG: 50S ribosomal protein L29 [Patescibacteria group bacterium]
MDIQQIRKISTNDIYKQLKKLNDEMLKKRMDVRMQILYKSSSENINVSELTKMKKEIARFKTVLTEKKYLEKLGDRGPRHQSLQAQDPEEKQNGK